MRRTRKYKQRGGFDFWGLFSSKPKVNNVNSVSKPLPEKITTSGGRRRRRKTLKSSK
jgi:hypothetical protein